MFAESLQPGVNLQQVGLPAIAGWADLRINGGRPVPYIETNDFPIGDPWSVHFRRTIAGIRDEGRFDGSWVTEFGAGDLRNLMILKERITGYTAVELDGDRLPIARANSSIHPILERTPHQLVQADAVDYLNEWRRERPGEKIKGWVLICLPQSPQGSNSTDTDNSVSRNGRGYDRFADYRQFDPYALTLNAAVLGELRKVADANLRVLIVNSHRVTEDVRLRVINQTGWEKAYEYESPHIQQDPRTGIRWIHERGLDDGNRFYERTRYGVFKTISAEEAANRQDRALGSRRSFKVWHKLSVYELIPNPVYPFSSIGRADK